MWKQQEMSEKEKERLKKFQDLCADTQKNEIKIFMLPAYSTEVEWLEVASTLGWKSKVEKEKERWRQKRRNTGGRGPMSLELLERIKMIEEKVKAMKEEKYHKLVAEFPKV